MELRIFACGSADYNKALALRYEELRKPLGLQFTEKELAKDLQDMHFGLFEAEHIVACLTLTKEPGGKVKMRQVATAKERQGTGLGRQLASEAEKYCRENGFETLYCHARKTAVPFYSKLGYIVISEEFTEVNIPHFIMQKNLRDGEQ